MSTEAEGVSDVRDSSQGFAVSGTMARCGGSTGVAFHGTVFRKYFLALAERGPPSVSADVMFM